MVGNFEGWVGNEEVLEFNPRRVPNPSRVWKKKQFCMVGNFGGWVGNEEVLEFNPRRLWNLFPARSRILSRSN